ncbi:MAG: GNAT family N-acetyltransferase [Micavibrio sp.]
MTHNIVDNRDKGRYELMIGGQIVFANYRIEGDTLFINYVESPEALRGTGAAGKLMEGIMAIAEKQKLQIVPICGYAGSWIRRHPQYQDLLKA